MQLPTESIINSIRQELKGKVEMLKKKDIEPLLCTVLIGHSPEQESFVRIKKRVGEELGIKFEFIHLTQSVTCDDIKKTLSDKTNNKSVNGIIVQQPLPESLKECDIYSVINANKEIEGHTEKSPFLPPIGLAALTGWFATTTQNANSYILADKEYSLLKKLSEGKSVVVVGRGITGGAPIYYTLTHLGIRCQVVHSQTPHKDEILKRADVVITAVGKKIITPACIKKGVVLLNLGLSRREGRLRGDYDEEEIASIASFYTKTPGGLGPIDVLYLYKNLITAAGMQHGIVI